MSVYLDVPFVSQLNFGGGLNDPTGCWYCSCCMIAFHFEAGPRQGVPELYQSGGHLPIGGQQATNRIVSLGGSTSSGGEEILAKRENLEPVPNLSTNRKLSELEMLLRAHGPLYFAWTKGVGKASYGHISVLIGTDDGKSEIIFHDPENSANSRMKLSAFDTLRMRGTYDFMRRKDVIAGTVKIKTP